MQKGIDKFLMLVAEAEGAGVNIFEDDKITQLLTALPDSYSVLVTSLEVANED